MTPEDLAHAKAQRLADPAARQAAEFAAAQLGVLMAQRVGVVTRAELMAAGLNRSDIDRLVRRRSLCKVHPRVYVDHTGPLTYDQRLWAAVLAVEPAVLCGTTVVSPDPRDKVIHVAVDATRTVISPQGVRVHRVRGLAAVAQWRAVPPRMRREDAVLMLVDEAETELDVVRLLTDGARDRAIGVERLREAERRRSRLSRRAFVRALLDDIATGVESVLEHLYLARVERPHGLPRASRQVLRRTPSGRQYRDVVYADHDFVVELDSQFHDTFDVQGLDADRDLVDQADGRRTARLRWRQVVGDPCRTAARLAAVMGCPVRPCGPGCPAGRA